MSTALLVIDYINEMAHPEGKLAQGKGYRRFLEEHSTIEYLNEAIRTATADGTQVIFVGLGFDPSYSDQPKASLVFGKAADFGILTRGSWSSAVYDGVEMPDNALYLTKQRVSPFFGTFLEGLLRNLNVTHIKIAGIATDLAVEAAARDAHDRDFAVSVLADASATSSIEEHEAALQTMRKFANVV